MFYIHAGPSMMWACGAAARPTPLGVRQASASCIVTSCEKSTTDGDNKQRGVTEMKPNLGSKGLRHVEYVVRKSL